MKNAADIFDFVSKENETVKLLVSRNNAFVQEGVMNYASYQWKSIVLLSLNQPSFLLKHLQISFDLLQKNIDQPVYEEFKIAKKRGGYRTILSPNQELKFIQRELNDLFQSYYFWIKPNEVHGFVINPIENTKSCNILENAKPHVGKKYVLNLDLQDFFPNISAKRVKKMLMSPIFRFDEQMANVFTLLLTFKGRLPIGAPSSPVISNFICLELDEDLIHFANQNQLTYTRYADDLTFSSDHLIDSDIIQSLSNLIHKNEFLINQKKLRMAKYSSKQTVTGLTVNEKPNVDRKMLKKIRAMLHDLSNNGIYSATKTHFNIKSVVSEQAKTKFLNKLEGYINFVGQIRGVNNSMYYKFSDELEYAIGLMQSDFCH